MRMRLGRAWSWLVPPLAVMLAILVVYLRLRGDPESNALPARLELLLIFAFLAVGLATWSAWATWRRCQQSIEEWSRRLSGLGERPSPESVRHAIQQEAWLDLSSLGPPLEDMVHRYRLALTERVADLEGSPNQRLQATRAVAERDLSQSFIHQSAGGYANSSRLMVARLATNLHWVAATPSLQQFLGESVNDLVARSFLSIVHPDDASMLSRSFQEVLKQGEGHNIKFRVRGQSAEERHVQMDVYARYSDTGTPMHLRCHFLDVTEQVATEQELRRRTEELSRAIDRLRQANADLERLKESYRDLYHNVPALHFSLDARGSFAGCNETLLRTLGYQREDLIGQPYTRLLDSESRQHFLQEPTAFQQSGEVETRWIKKDGTLLDVWIRTTTQIDAQGRFERSRSTALDVTDRTRLANVVRAKAEELERANAELRRINQELEEFTHVVSHDLKEPLRTLQTFSSFLDQDYGHQLGTDGQEHIRYLIQASRRLGLLIDDLLTLSRAGRIMNAPQVFDLSRTVQTVCGDLADLIQRKGAVVRVEGTLPEVTCDPERVMQLLANLVGNGLKYNNNPRPEVVIGQAFSDQGLPESDPGHATLFVRDNGIGIDSRYHEQIFRIFRRLHHHEEYDGTGAGLAICKKIVEAHGGRIWVASSPGEGSTFFFTLPRPSAPDRDNSEVQESTAARNGDEFPAVLESVASHSAAGE